MSAPWWVEASEGRDLDDDELVALYEFGEDEDPEPEPPYPVQPWEPYGGWQLGLFPADELSRLLR